MNFGEQIKHIRNDHHLTQEAFARELNVSRQAVSNWENNRNLPDLEMLISISQVFHISLDELIMGGNSVNNMTEKLIKDGSETRKAKLNMMSICAGTALLMLGIACLAIKSASVEYIDASGVLHENFFLLPISFVLFFGGFITFFVTGIRNAAALLFGKESEDKKNKTIYICICAAVSVICVLAVILLRIANGG